MSGTTTVMQYLTFTLASEVFAFDVARVREVLEMIHITRVPQTPAYMSGVSNVRGSMVPVIDLRAKLEMGAAVRTVNTCIIVLEVGLGDGLDVIGVLVDSVREVVDLEPSQISEPPRFGTGMNERLLTGIAKCEDGFVLIMDTARLLSDTERRAIADAGPEEV